MFCDFQVTICLHFNFVTEVIGGSVLVCLKPKLVVVESDESVGGLEELVCLYKIYIKS